MPGTYYVLNLEGDLLKVGFGDPASNDTIVKDVVRTLDEMREDGKLAGGPLLKINGPASLPVAVVLTHALAHIYGVVSVWDPKLQKYVVSVSHDPFYDVGDLID